MVFPEISREENAVFVHEIVDYISENMSVKPKKDCEAGR